jgi:thiosulfate dehydrogenase (quinone) large subunit
VEDGVREAAAQLVLIGSRATSAEKIFGLGYATPAARAWINGGSPTKGFLSGAIGPLQGVFNSIAGAPVVDWLFMLGLLGVGLALILGVAVRAGAVFGAVMLALMYLAVWVPSTTAAGQPSGSTNPSSMSTSSESSV